VIAGWQVEGTIANNQAQLGVTQSSLSNRTTVTTPPGTTATQSTLTTSNFIDSLAERWAVSALGRFGVLVDPRDLIYVIGGYTYGGFDWSGRTFGLHGATVGAGWEHEVAPGWTFKAEYRYTRFQGKDLSSSSSTASNQVQASVVGTAALATNATSAITDRVSGVDLHALRFGITHYFSSGAPVVSAYAMATKGPPLFAMPWDGPYSGVSFGPASIRATTSTVTHGVTNSTITNAVGTIQASTTVSDTFSNGSGSNWGAQSDVYLGYNFRLGSNGIAGLQVEGTIAENQAQLSAAQSSVSNRTTVTTPPGTTATTSTVSSLNFVDSLAERWAVSALGKLGVLVDPRDLIYVIGGYTYGGFDWSDRTFGLHGATVGAGWEREVAPGWTFKAEYRYTRFQDKDLPRSSSTATNIVQVSAAGAVTTTVSNGTSASTDHVSGIASHALRFGITHYFSSGAPVVSAYAMATKAPPPVMPAWTGLYGGVSFGLTSMHTSTASTSNELLTQTQASPVVTFTDVETVNSVFNSSGRHGGAVADIFVGYSAALAANVIGGVQFEGGLARAATLGSGTFSQVIALTEVQTPPGGDAGTTTLTATNTGTTTFAVRSRWMASALARLGWLVDPRDLVYAIGGWTYGGFLTGSRPFELNGPTVGVGFEREVAPSWTVKAEYRYTHFRARDVPITQSQTQTSTIGVTTSSFSDVINETDRIAVNLHALRFGITHYFETR
jgi:opacity protein-like surface antigen